jgi:hypothetical protein
MLTFLVARWARELLILSSSNQFPTVRWVFFLFFFFFSFFFVLLFVPDLSLVSETELKRLWRRFKKLDKDNSGTLTADEFLSVPEVKKKKKQKREKDEKMVFADGVAFCSWRAILCWSA